MAGTCSSVIDGTGDVVFSVPYVGFKGDYQSIVAIPDAPVLGKLNAPFHQGPADLHQG